MSDVSPSDTREAPHGVHSTRDGVHSTRAPDRSRSTQGLPPVQPEVDTELHAVKHLVHEEFDEQLDPGAVDETLNSVTSRFTGAPVRVFVPLLVRRYAREELKSRLRDIR